MPGVCTGRDSLTAASAAPHQERAGEDEGEAEGALEGEGADGEAEEAEVVGEGGAEELAARSR